MYYYQRLKKPVQHKKKTEQRVYILKAGHALPTNKVNHLPMLCVKMTTINKFFRCKFTHYIRIKNSLPVNKH